jgi:hypothetical protein
MPTRREFLATAAVPLVPIDRAPVVDTHLHCFAGSADARFPYHKDGPYQPADAATPDHLLKCMTDGGTDFAVVVHPEPYQYRLTKRTSAQVRGNGVVRLDS